MRIQFEEQLERLNVEMIKMGALCEEAIALAAKALTEGDAALAAKVAPLGAEIDQMEKTKISVQEFSKKQEEYKNWALLVFALLLIEILLRNTLLRNIP